MTTHRQRLFVAEYLVDLSGTQAAIRAGYSERTARSQGHRLLKNPEVLEAIVEARARLEKAAEVRAADVINELKKVAFANLSDVTDWGIEEIAIGFDGDGKRLAPEDIGEAVMVHYVKAPFVTPINRADLSPEIRAAVAEVGLGKDGFKIKMHNKIDALEKIGRILGMFKDRVDITSGDKPMSLADFYGKFGADPRPVE